MPNPKRGEIWRVNFDPVVGSEAGKARPAVVVQDDELRRLPVRVVVPVTGWDRRYEEHLWMTESSAADATQIRTVSVARFMELPGKLPAGVVDEIAASITVCVGAPRQE